MNFSLLATVIVAQWTFSGTISWSSLATVQFGVAGQYWFAAGTAAHLLLFSIVACEVRVKAPGAKTYLQVIRARFGGAAHVIAMTFSIVTIIVVIGIVLTEGAQLMSSLVNGFSFEAIIVIISIIVGLYTVIGGLGGLICAAYMACVVFFAIALFFLTAFIRLPEPAGNGLGTTERVYNIVSCVHTVAGNEQNSLLTFISLDGLVYGVLLILCNFSVVFVDQSFWQCGMAAKPSHGVWGFITAAVCYFAIPFSLSYVFGFTYWNANLSLGRHTLSPQQEMHGFIPIVAAQQIAATTGSFLMYAFLMIAVVTTLSNEILAISSIIVYDIYQTYVSPFTFPLVAQLPNQVQSLQRTEDYLRYDQRSTIVKHVAVIAASLLMIPIALVVNATMADMQWLTMALGVFVGSAVAPVTLSITWHRITRSGFIAGCIGGMVSGVVAWLIYASTYPGGLTSFLTNTGQPYAMLTGLTVSFGVGGLLCIAISLPCGGCDPTLSEEEQWEYTRLIDNPILPWQVKYATEVGSNSFKGKPHFYTVRRAFRYAEIIAYIIGVLLALGVLLLWPGFMLTANVFSVKVFENWSNLVLALTAIGCGVLSFVPLASELFIICRQAYYNRDWKRHEQNNPSSTPRTLSSVGLAGRSRLQLAQIEKSSKYYDNRSSISEQPHSIRHRQRSNSVSLSTNNHGTSREHIRRRSESQIIPMNVLPPSQSTTYVENYQSNLPSGIAGSYQANLHSGMVESYQTTLPTAYVTRTDVLHAVDRQNTPIPPLYAVGNNPIAQTSLATPPMYVVRDNAAAQSTFGYNNDGGPQRWKTFIRLE